MSSVTAALVFVLVLACLSLLLLLRKLYYLDTAPLKISGKRVVFLDIGGHIGQSTHQAILSNLFDQIYTFEPVPGLASKIEAIAHAHQDHRALVEIIVAALGIDDGEATLYMPGTHSGTIYQNRWKKDPDSIVVPKLDSGRWFKENLRPDDVVFVKINCEGGEVGIIDSLERSSQLSKIELVMIDFDVKRLFGRDDERLRLIRILEENAISFLDPRYVEKWGFGTGYLSVLRIITYLRIVRKILAELRK